MRSSGHSLSRSSERRRQSRQVVAGVLQQLAEGELLAEEVLVQRHPELLPELVEELRRARAIRGALVRADELIGSSQRQRDAGPQPEDGKSTWDPQDPQDPQRSEPADMPARIGRYRIERVIGRGGFGRVYLAWDEELDRRVAIKTPHRQRLSEPAAISSYLAEARLLARLDHPVIVPVYDVGRTDEGGCYVVSKWIQGTDLATRLRQSRLSPEAAIRLTIEIAGALHYAHGQGIVHRDIKPANILLDQHERPCLVDFGLALQEDALPDTGCWAGTPRYMSPEQARGEAHRVDGRSDIFSLGTVLYESLTGQRPFSAGTYGQLLEQIISVDPVPPRHREPSISAELDRICLKMLAKRSADRYATANELIIDLQHLAHPRLPSSVEGSTALTEPLAGSSLVGTPLVGGSAAAARIVPKGLRCFDADDASFYLELVPGPRDRCGIPETIRQWKRRVEELDADETFAVGLMYGPSGCGKSSWLRAGLLPLLASHVEAVYVEASCDDTESQLLKRLHKRMPDLPVEAGLARCLGAIRRGSGPPPGHKLLVVIDQFEQWLSGRSEQDRRTLIESLRQCDGTRLQCLLLVRDDFWLAISRFMSELEVELIQGFNTGLVDLFDPRHARQVLIRFGQSYGRLPNRIDELSAAEREFLDGAVAGLTEEGQVIPVRLALFTEMVKSRPWNSDTLRAIGGSQGVGVTFLEETFCARSANPLNRAHERGARAVLAALLPRPGSPIKGHVRPYPELLDLAGYGQKPREFKQLMRILDSETRLLTPADRIVDETTQHPAIPPVRYYQLTHDYLVPALRDWLTRKQKATSAGRAELRLAERAAMWDSMRERRQLPSLWEWLSIRMLTRARNWTETQRRMMRIAAWRHTAWSAGGLAAACCLLIAGAELTTWARDLSVHIRARTAPLWLMFGREDAVLSLLKADEDPTLRTQLIHGLSPLTITLERLVARATEIPDPSVRRALLLAAGEMAARREAGPGSDATDDPIRPVSELLLLQGLVELYQRDPDPGVHATAEWAIEQFGHQPETARLNAQWRSSSPRPDQQWWVTPEGHTLVVIPGPARFRMGAGPLETDQEGNAPPHEVLIRRSFAIANKETTWAHFQRFLAASSATARQPLPMTVSPENVPQLQVTWHQAAAYCNWLSEREGIPRDQWCFVPYAADQSSLRMAPAPDWFDRRGYRLPAEAEWEYACRAGTETAWHFGSDPALLAKYAQGAPAARGEPSPVGQHKPNDFGLFDILGNAAEWCMDPYSPGDGSTGDRISSATSRTEVVADQVPRVIRGGSFIDDAPRLRCSARAGMLPNQAASNVGFRIARSYP